MKRCALDLASELHVVLASAMCAILPLQNGASSLAGLCTSLFRVHDQAAKLTYQNSSTACQKYLKLICCSWSNITPLRTLHVDFLEPKPCLCFAPTPRLLTALFCVMSYVQLPHTAVLVGGVSRCWGFLFCSCSQFRSVLPTPLWWRNCLWAEHEDQPIVSRASFSKQIRNAQYVRSTHSTWKYLTCCVSLACTLQLWTTHWTSAASTSSSYLYTSRNCRRWDTAWDQSRVEPLLPPGPARVDCEKGYLRCTAMPIRAWNGW